MPLSDYLTQIRSSCPKLTDKETNLFAKGLEVQTLAPDDIFLCVGDVPQSVAYVSKGLIKAVYTDFEGSRVNVNFFREGTGVCDYQAFRERSGSRYDFIAIEPCTLILLQTASKPTSRSASKVSITTKKAGCTTTVSGITTLKSGGL